MLFFFIIRHQELLEQNGQYAEMWQSQLINEQQEGDLPDANFGVQDGNSASLLN